MPNEPAALAKAALARGDLIAAYDVTTAAIAEGDPSGTIRHQQVLALARMGDTERAMGLFEAYGLDRSNNAHERAIGARLLKDRALAAAPGAGRQEAILRAQAAYHDIYRDSGDSFPGINAATLALLAGDGAQSQALASALLADPAVAAGGDYYMAATRAEALLLLGRTAEVTETLAGEAIRGSGDYGGRSSTLRQLAMVAAHLGIGEAERAALLAPLAPPRVAHFCGHMFGADASAEAKIRAALDAVIAEEAIGFAYGALACGADIIIAEAMLERGVELHVVLPFEEEDFLLQSVRPGGSGWEARYRACRDRAATVEFASAMAFFGNPAQFGYASRTAMGMARLGRSISPPKRCRSRSGTASRWRGRPEPAPTSPSWARRRRANPHRRSGPGRTRPGTAAAAGDDTL